MSYAIDPELAPLLEFLPEGSFSDVEESRAFLAALVEPMNANVDTSGLEIVDREISGPDGAVPVRVYAREGDAPAGGRPALLDIHGGGFVTGNIEMEHAFAVQVARGTRRRRGRGRLPLGARASVPCRGRGLLLVAEVAARGSRRARHRPGTHRGRRSERGRWARRGDGVDGARSWRTARVLPVPRHPRAGSSSRDREHARLRRHAGLAPTGSRAELGALPRTGPGNRVSLRLARDRHGPRAACRRPTSRRWSSIRCETRESSTRCA